MKTDFITLNKENISSEHICCAFSDKKCKESYELKKEWLTREFDNGFVFRRLNERAKVFIEYSPAEQAWIPVIAPDYLVIHCLWVSGQYKRQGYGKALLQSALDDATRQGKAGLIAITGKSKVPFMGDPRWLIRQGFEMAEQSPDGFSLLVRKLNPDAKDPRFNESVLSRGCPDKEGLVAYYSHRCPFTEYHIRHSLTETVKKRGIPLKIIQLETREQAQTAPTPATIFSLFYNGRFITTDISACMDSRFDKYIKVE